MIIQIPVATKTLCMTVGSSTNEVEVEKFISIELSSQIHNHIWKRKGSILSTDFLLDRSFIEHLESLPKEALLTESIGNNAFLDSEIGHISIKPKEKYERRDSLNMKRKSESAEPPTVFAMMLLASNSKRLFSVMFKQVDQGKLTKPFLPYMETEDFCVEFLPMSNRQIIQIPRTAKTLYLKIHSTVPAFMSIDLSGKIQDYCWRSHSDKSSFTSFDYSIDDQLKRFAAETHLPTPIKDNADLELRIGYIRVTPALSECDSFKLKKKRTDATVFIMILVLNPENQLFLKFAHVSDKKSTQSRMTYQQIVGTEDVRVEFLPAECLSDMLTGLSNAHIETKKNTWNERIGKSCSLPIFATKIKSKTKGKAVVLAHEVVDGIRSGEKMKFYAKRQSRSNKKASQTYANYYGAPLARIEDIDDYFYAPEKENYFKAKITTESVVEAIKRLPTHYGEIYYDSAEQREAEKIEQFMIGAVSSKFFSSCSWGLIPPKQVDKDLIRFYKPLVDIDQVAMLVKNFNPFVEKSFKDCSTNWEFLTMAHKIISSEVFGRACCTLYPLKYRTLSWFNRKGKGGNSYMSKRERRDFIAIFCSNVKILPFKASVRFTSCSNERNVKENKSTFDNFFCIPIAQISTENEEGDLYEVMNIYLSNKRRIKPVPWSLKDHHEKVLLACYMVCYFLCHYTENFRDMNEFESFFDPDSAEVKIDVPEGEKVPFLVFFQLCALERALGVPNQSIDLVLESYGSKKNIKSEINMSEPNEKEFVDIASYFMQEHSRTGGTADIWRFSNLCHTRFDRKKENNILVVGFGCEFQAELSGKKMYPIVNILSGNEANSNFDLSFRNEVVEEEEEVLEEEREEEAEEEQDMDEIKFSDSEEVRKKQDINSLQTAVMESIFTDYSVSFYSVLGRALPLHLQPCTSAHGNIRRQTYSVNLRGASKRIFPREVLANEEHFLIHSPPGTIFDLDEFNRKVEAFFKSAQKEMNIFRNTGNAVRLEQTLVIDHEQSFSQEICKGIKDCVSFCSENVELYEVEHVTTFAEFFLSALRFHVSVLGKLLSNDKQVPASLLLILPEVCAVVRNYFAGRETFREKHIFGKKFGILHNRPILATIKELRLLEKEQLKVDLLWKQFIADLNCSSLINDCELFLTKTACSVVHVKKYCKFCYRLFTLPLEKQPQLHFCVTDGLESVEHPEFLRNAASTDCDYNQRVTFLLKDLHYQQCYITNKVVARSEHVLVSGVGGTGKTRAMFATLYKLSQIDDGIARTAVISITKNAASLLYGNTVHAFFNLTKERINEPNFLPVFYKKYQEDTRKLERPYQYQLISQLETLIIDECGLLTADGLENIDLMLCMIRQTKDPPLPFGGLKIVLVGDVMQMTPIQEKKEQPTNRSEYKLADLIGVTEPQKPSYFFQSRSYSSTTFRICYLTNVYRQQDEEEIELLRKIRVGGRLKDGKEKIEMEPYLKIMNEQWGKGVPKQAAIEVRQALIELDRKESSGEKGKESESKFKYKMQNLWVQDRHYIGDSHDEWYNTFIEKLSDAPFDPKDLLVICTENAEVVAVSSWLEKYASKGKQVISLAAVDTNDKNYPNSDWQKEWIERETDLPTNFDCFTGKQVKFTDNRTHPYCSNNMLGTVTGTMVENNSVITVLVKPYLLNESENLQIPVIKVFRVEAKSEKNGCTYTRCQFPLISAYAVTNYTVQGITIPKEKYCILSNSRLTQCGTLYTAYSRCSNKNQITSLFPLTSRDLKVDFEAFQFDCFLQDNNGLPVIGASQLKGYFSVSKNWRTEELDKLTLARSDRSVLEK